MAWASPSSSAPIKGVLLDISGVLRDGDEAIKGSVEAFHRLVDSGIPVRLVTNESQITREGSLKKLQRLGYTKGINLDIISAPAPILVKKLQKEGLKPYLLVHPNVKPEFDPVVLPPSEDDDPDCVVIGDAAGEFTYENMNLAFRTLLKMEGKGKKPRLFTLGKGRYYKEDDLLWMDVGPFCAGLEYALDIKAELSGKPAPSFFHGALESMGVKPEEAVMIGDDILGDVKGAQDAGLRGVLVRTGKFRPTDENHPVVKPDGIVDNLAEAVDIILSSSGTSCK